MLTFTKHVEDPRAAASYYKAMQLYRGRATSMHRHGDAYHVETVDTKIIFKPQREKTR